VSVRDVPEGALVPGVSRLRHVELGTDLVYEGAGDGFVWVRPAEGGQSGTCHVDDVELVR
jgi:hypothetical protein